MKERITVLVGIYNCAQTLPEALDSLMNQTFKNFKVVLCDDGSKDDTLRVAEQYAQKYSNIIVIKNERNMGLNYTLNHCLKYADTEYVARMDGDDISLPTRFEKEIDFLDNHPEYSVVSTPMLYFDENGVFRKGEGRGEVKSKDFIHGTPVTHAPCMVRTDVIKSVGGYTESDRLLRVEDYHLWFKIFAAGHRLYMLDECLYMMRDDRNAIQRRNWKDRKNEAYVKHVGYRMIGLPWYNQMWIVVPIVKYFVPRFIYKMFHKR